MRAVEIASAPDAEEGEAVRTEISCKYDRATVDDLFEQAGLAVDQWVEDDRGYHALVLGTNRRVAATAPGM